MVAGVLSEPPRHRGPTWLRLTRRVPTYVWTFLALVAGLAAGGFFPSALAPVADATSTLIAWVVAVVPLLILAALSPAIATLVRRGLAGRFAGAVVLWYVFTSTVAGLIALVAAAIFRIPLTTGDRGVWTEAAVMLRSLGEGGASWPLLAILAGVLLGLFGARNDPTYRVLKRVADAIEGMGHRLAYVMLPLILAFGVTLGVRFGARLGLSHYLTMTAYTAGLVLVWWAFYTFVLVRRVGRRPVGPVLSGYYVPTAVFAAGTCSSLATLPVNLANAKKVGVRDEVADFVLPFGAVVNLDASALAYVAYGPFVVSYVFGLELSWMMLLAAWPAVVLFTIAAPGLPAGMGTALWSATLFASILGLEGQAQGEFIASWIALSGGLPDMLRTATNTTGDGYTAIIFDGRFDEFFASDRG
ncbi:cation:dicarboxylate symporter family transporter [Candidatus Palauibacter sp.]|uniref:cation:dicarboxylate symporter family transporter n=1 Tax=Candidatus Palauibacter sp. TaxID=3101350 RepID=UPI003B5A2571